MQEPSWPGCLKAWEQLGCLVAPGVGVGVGWGGSFHGDLAPLFIHK